MARTISPRSLCSRPNLHNPCHAKDRPLPCCGVLESAVPFRGRRPCSCWRDFLAFSTASQPPHHMRATDVTVQTPRPIPARTRLSSTHSPKLWQKINLTTKAELLGKQPLLLPGFVIVQTHLPPENMSCCMYSQSRQKKADTLPINLDVATYAIVGERRTGHAVPEKPHRRLGVGNRERGRFEENL